MSKHKTVRVGFLGVLVASMLGGFAACSGGGNSGDDDDDGNNNGSSGQGGSMGSSGSPFGGSTGFPGGTQGTGGGAQAQALLVEPATVTLTAKGAPLTQTFTAKFRDGTVAQNVTWSVDDVSLGLMNSGGVFTSKGFSGGTTTVRASANGRQGTAQISITVNIVDGAEGPNAVTPDDQGKLQTGDAVNGEKIGFLYPYDETVFPRGVGAPAVQLRGVKATDLRLLVETDGFRYEGFFKGAKSVNQIGLRDDVWQGLIASAKPGAPVKVTATTLAAGKASAPATQTWRVAPGSLKGIVYYNSYDSRLPGVPDDNDGRPGGPAVLAIKPGQAAEPLLTGCTVCHSVSSQGNRLITGIDWVDDPPETGEVPNNPRDSGSYELKADGTAVSKKVVGDGRRYSFGALSPDGAWFLSNGVKGGDSQYIRGLQGTPAELPSKLYETDTGALVPTANALGVNFAFTPAFSHDGTKIAFNRIEKNALTLSVVDFNGTMTPPSFGQVVDLLTEAKTPFAPTSPSGLTPTTVRAWPSFLPDSKALVFHEGTQFDTGNSHEDPEISNPNNPDPPPSSRAFANIRMVELASKRVVALRALNGETPDGADSTLPYGKNAEGSLNYEPTVLPVPVGGYYWVFFTSRRAYGNTISPAPTLGANEGGVAGGDDPFGKELNGKENPSPRKKIWVAAIDLDYAEKIAADPNYDPSHPAFFVTGQELQAGNMRAFAALEPCRQNGSSCESSAECCDGRSCRQGTDANGQPVLQCADPPPNSCALEDDACTSASQCCPDENGSTTNILCINGRCARKPPPVIR
jgi:hypothetical protein